MANIEQITVGNTTYDITSSGTAISENYSTTEKEVGTWLDGKKIYQKTFTGTVLSKANVTLVASTIIPNVSNIIDYKIGYKSIQFDDIVAGYCNSLTNIDGTQGVTCTINGFAISSANSPDRKFKLIISNTWTRTIDYVLTILYTK